MTRGLSSFDEMSFLLLLMLLDPYFLYKGAAFYVRNFRQMLSTQVFVPLL